MEKDNIISLASYRERKPVLRLIDWPVSVIKHELFHFFLNSWREMPGLKARIVLGLISNDGMTFANVLNVPESEDIWPGDAAELFYPELFACRLSGIDHIYDDKSMFAEHKRCEILRLCSEGHKHPLMEYFDYDFYRCMEQGAFPSYLFGDGGDDEGVLLLTQIVCNTQ